MIVGLIKRLGLFVATLVLLLGLLEVGTRLLTGMSAPILVKDPEIGVRYQSSFETSLYVPEARRKVPLRFNRHGFRGPDRDTTAPENTHRIAIIGDSFVASIGVDEKDTFVARLESRLNEAKPEHSWEVMNFGVSGSSIGQELALYKSVVRQLAPDVVLLTVFVGNDLADNCRCLSTRDRIYYDFDEQGDLIQLPYSVSRKKVTAFLNQHSRFYVWQKHTSKKVRDNLRESMSSLPAGAWVYCADRRPDNVEYAWRLADATIERFAKTVRADGAAFGLLLLPAPEQMYDDIWNSFVERSPDHGDVFDREFPDRRFGEIAERHQVPMVSVYPAFRAKTPSRDSKLESEWVFHQGLGHLNELGNAMVAEALEPFVGDLALPSGSGG